MERAINAQSLKEMLRYQGVPSLSRESRASRGIKEYQESLRGITSYHSILYSENQQFHKVSIAINSYKEVSRGIKRYQKVSNCVKSINSIKRLKMYKDHQDEYCK